MWLLILKAENIDEFKITHLLTLRNHFKNVMFLPNHHLLFEVLILVISVQSSIK